MFKEQLVDCQTSSKAKHNVGELDPRITFKNDSPQVMRTMYKKSTYRTKIREYLSP